MTRASTRRQAAHTLVPPLQAESSGGSNAPSSKRAFPNGEATPAPKAKRPKAKAKTTDSETPSKSTARTCSHSLFVIPLSVPYFRHSHLKISSCSSCLLYFFFCHGCRSLIYALQLPPGVDTMLRGIVRPHLSLPRMVRFQFTELSDG